MLPTPLAIFYGVLHITVLGEAARRRRFDTEALDGTAGDNHTRDDFAALSADFQYFGVGFGPTDVCARAQQALPVVRQRDRISAGRVTGPTRFKASSFKASMPTTPNCR
jgi:hypothetical protein